MHPRTPDSSARSAAAITSWYHLAKSSARFTERAWRNLGHGKQLPQSMARARHGPQAGPRLRYLLKSSSFFCIAAICSRSWAISSRVSATGAAGLSLPLVTPGMKGIGGSAHHRHVGFVDRGKGGGADALFKGFAGFSSGCRGNWPCWLRDRRASAPASNCHTCQSTGAGN